MRGSFTEEEKERALAFIRQNPHVKLPELARKFSSISESSLAKWRQEIRNGDNAGQHEGTDSEGGEKPKKLSERQKLKAAEQLVADYYHTIEIRDIQFAYLRAYWKASDDLTRRDIEIQYLLALLKLYGCEKPERLGEEGEQEQTQGE